MMMGIQISSPSFIYGDNMSLVYNTSRPEQVLRKKSNSICYHAAYESVAICESLVKHVPCKENVADLVTKVLYGYKRRYLVSIILYDIHDDLQLSVLAMEGMHIGKLDPIDHSINIEGTRSMHP